MATKLILYNQALTVHLGERKLASLTEAREPRRVLDDIWDAGIVDQCLEEGQWKFATRVAKLSYSSSVTPSFGHNRAFEKPTDYVRLCALCSDEFYQATLMHYEEEAGFWFASIDDIYVKYVSNDASYGNDLTLWTPGFSSYVAAALAYKACNRITQSKTSKDDLKDEMDRLLGLAKSTDAMSGPPKVAPEGSWNRARGGNSVSDRGNRSSLLG